VGRPEGKRPPGSDVKGRIVLIWIFKKYDGAWSNQAQHGKRWPVVDAVMKLRIAQNEGIFTSCGSSKDFVQCCQLLQKEVIFVF
jgi:hypothetical protein